jgi:predicted HD phosphohydrolase
MGEAATEPKPMFSALRQEIADIYAGRAHRKYGLEDISQLEHALQTAHLAERQGERPATILAALLHDIGHMTHDLGENPAAEGVDDRHDR